MSIYKEFVDAKTARLALVQHGGLGVFELLHSTEEPMHYSFVLRLDTYQSNCHRLWLEYRWLFQSLIGAQVILSEGPCLLLTISKCFETEKNAQIEFVVWHQMLVQEVNHAAMERA